MSQIVRRLVEAIDPDRIILFGSRARGDARAESDFDLLAVKTTRERALRLAQLAHRAMYEIPATVDILVETPERLERLKDAPGLAFRDALREGRLVYERTS